MTKKTLTILILVAVSSCTDAEWDASIGKFNDNAKVRCYSAGNKIYSGLSTGAVKRSQLYGVYQFREKGSEKFVEVSGDCVIEYSFK